MSKEHRDHREGTEIRGEYHKKKIFVFSLWFSVQPLCLSVLPLKPCYPTAG